MTDDNALEAAAEIDRLRGELAAIDRLLRASVPQPFKGTTSPVGAVQSSIAELEVALAARDARIAAWLRNGAKGIRKDSEDGLWDDEDEAELIADDWEFLATAIEDGSHLEEGV